MSLESILYSRLSNVSGGLYALVSTRIYPVRFPQNGTMPCVTYQRVTADRDSAMGSDSGLVFALFQIDSWGRTPDEARSVFDAVRERMQRWRDTGPPVVQDTFIETETENYEEEAELYRVLSEIRIDYLES